MSGPFDSVAAFPLCWPSAWPRAKSRQESRFKVGTVYEATQGLLAELARHGASGIIVSTSVPLRQDGLPLSKPPVDGDPGAAVYFLRKGKPFCIACDRYTQVYDNIHAIALSSAMIERVFTGFEALPAPKDHWEILGVPPGSSTDVLNRQYRKLARLRHPDVGGSTEAMAELNDAYQKCLREVK